MALSILNRPWQHTSEIDPFDFENSVVDIPIGGKLVQSKFELSPTEQMHFRSDDDYKRAIKSKMANELARYMIEANLVEFTHMPHNTIGNDIIYARCYLAPDDNVKILRMHYAPGNKR